MLNDLFSRKIMAGALLLLTIGVPVSALAVEGSEKVVSQEVIQAKASVWREAAGTTENPSGLFVQATFPDQLWWERFQDPYLTGYIQKAVSANLTLATAHQRIQEARALARQSLGKEFPQLSIAPSFTRARNSATIIPNLNRMAGGANGAAGAGGTGGGMGGGFALGQVINNYTLPLTASYEADIWLKNRDATRATKKDLEAIEQEFHATHVMVVTDLANAYFNLLAADQLIDLQQEIIHTAESDLGHAQRRFEAGLVDEEDVVLRQGRLTDFKAALQDAYQSQALALNQMALLMGQTPSQVSELPRADWQHYAVPSEITGGLPSELLTRRPDILAAENRLKAAGFRVRVARKEMLPSINLNGQFGYASATRENLFKWDSYIASAGASLLQPLFTGGQKRANLKVFKARHEQQLLAYRNSVLQSFKEVDDALASLKAHRNAYEAYQASLVSLEQREHIQQNRLTAGAISEADVNPVRLEVAQAKAGLTRAKLYALSDTLSLYKALGGGY